MRTGAVTLRLICLGIPFALAAPASALPNVEYRFNEAGPTVTNTGTDPTPASTYANASASTPSDMHGAAASGVSGLAGDRAFNNTASTGMGDGNTGGRAAQLADNGAIDGFKSFTVQGWFKTDSSTPISGFAGLVNNSGNGGGWVLSGTGGVLANLTLTVNTDTLSGTATAAPSNLPGPYTATQAWVFFAVSYDGTDNMVKFYQGSPMSAVSLFSTSTLSVAVNGAGDDDNPLRIGNGSAVDTRPFDGYIDDVRIFGSKVDASGVVALGTLEQLRQNDVSNTPEPGSVGVVIAAAALAGLRRRRAAM